MTVDFSIITNIVANLEHELEIAGRGCTLGDVHHLTATQARAPSAMQRDYLFFSSIVFTKNYAHGDGYSRLWTHENCITRKPLK